MSSSAIEALEKHAPRVGERHGRPLLGPVDCAAVVSLITEAQTSGANLAPTGHGTCLDWTLPEHPEYKGLHWLDTTALVPEGASGVLEYVSGDGTLTAQAGASMDELRDTVREGGHRITPALPGGSGTLGGLLASGRSGPDRTAFGPTRHHLLGTVAVDGSGRVHRSGGRLVKNVTGFDLHRLHAGGRGRLGVVLEASLRLMPIPEASMLVEGSAPSAAEAIEAALAVRARPGLRLTGLVVEGRRMWVHLAGRAAQVDADLEQVARTFDVRSCKEGDDAETALLEAWRGDRGWRVLTRPSRCADVAAVLLAAGVPEEALSVEPAAAIVCVGEAAFADHAEALRSEALPRLRELGVSLDARFADAPGWASTHPSGRAADWIERLEQAFDPAGVFAPTGGGAR